MEPREPELRNVYQAKKDLSDYLLRERRAEGMARRSRSIALAVADAASGRNVHAVGIGHKIVNGEWTGQVALRVYVSQKLDSSLLGSEAIPDEFEGVPTDVIESAPAFVLPTVTGTEEIVVPGIEGIGAHAAQAIPPCSAAKQRRQRPVRGGISAGHFSITAGTIACFCRSVRPGDDPGRVYALSNNHVFADVNQASLGDALLQQGRADGGGPADEFARLERFVPIQLSETASNRVDAAIGVIGGEIHFDPEICSIGRISGIVGALEQMRVRKHGRTTGLSHGAVTDVSYDAIVGMDHTNPNIVARFEDQLRIDGAAPTPVFGLGGDSGSLVVADDGNAAVGLYFAGPDSGLYGLANPIAEVLAALEIELI